jgi:methyl-accepting chemotaxis protein
VAVSKEVGDILHQIVEASGKVTTLIGEVTAASKEQAQGIDQVNTGVSQLDQVTQANAANAEESASAGEELSAQAVELSSMVASLVGVIEGAGSNAVVPQRSMSINQKPHSKACVKPGAKLPVKQAPRISKPESIIPLDDDDFADF